MNKNNINKILSIILVIISILLMSSIIIINIFNVLLIILVTIFILSINFISIFLIFKSKFKRIGLSLLVLLTIIFSILIFYINKTNNLLKYLDLNYKTYNYSILVSNNSNYNNIKDLDNKYLGYYEDSEKVSNEALKKVLKKVDINKNKYNDNYEMAKALLEGEVDAILIENTYLDILNDNFNFKGTINDIYNFTIVNSINDISKDINVTKEPFNIYVSGIDTYGEISSISRSDVNMIISINPNSRQILLTSIPRDYYVNLHGKNGYRDKLTHASLYGVNTSIKTLEDLLDIKINYYIKVNFSSIIDIVDSIDGIEVYSDYKFTSIDNYSYKKGYNKLNGEKALSFARERKAFSTGDRQRVKNQQAVFKAVLDKCMSKSIILKYNSLLDSIKGSFVTNMPINRITSLIKLQISKNYKWNIMASTLEGIDSSNYTYSTPNIKSYVMIPDEEDIDNASELIEEVLNGNNIDTTTVSYIDNNDKLNVKLVRSIITMNKGDEYIYHGYSATYDGEDITSYNNLKEEFIINNKIYDDYKDLVYYITNNLDRGKYKIKYNISYLGEVKTLEQELIIN